MKRLIREGLVVGAKTSMASNSSKVYEIVGRVRRRAERYNIGAMLDRQRWSGTITVPVSASGIEAMPKIGSVVAFSEGGRWTAGVLHATSGKRMLLALFDGRRRKLRLPLSRDEAVLLRGGCREDRREKAGASTRPEGHTLASGAPRARYRGITGSSGR